MIKLGLPADKELQNKLMEEFTEETSVTASQSWQNGRLLPIQ